jgi:hypothetical protein
MVLALITEVRRLRRREENALWRVVGPCINEQYALEDKARERAEALASSNPGKAFVVAMEVGFCRSVGIEWHRPEGEMPF